MDIPSCAQARLAGMYRDGIGVPEGIFLRGVLYAYGWGVPKDLGESVRWFRLAAAQGNTVARDHLKYLETPRKETVPSPQKTSPPK